MFFPLLFLTPNFVPRSMLTHPMEVAATYNPVTYVMEAMRSLILEDFNWGRIGAGYAVVVVAGAVMLRSTCGRSATTTEPRGTQPGVTVRIGTSGWQYASWKAPYYGTTPQRLWYEKLTGRLRDGRAQRVVLPAAQARDLRGLGPPGARGRRRHGQGQPLRHARQAAQGHRRLGGPADVARQGLGTRLGPVLVQLPPDLRAAPDDLAATLDHFPAGVRVAVEPRHESWWTDEVREVLTRARRRPGLGGPARPADRPAVADGVVGLPAAARGPGPPVAVLRSGRAGHLGVAAAGDVRRRPRLLRLLQQRPAAARRSTTPSPSGRPSTGSGFPVPERPPGAR